MGLVAQNTKRIIEERGLKQRAVAFKAGIPEKMLSDIINGRVIAKENHIIAISNALNITPNELFGINNKAS